VREESVGIGRFEGTFDICLLCRGSGIWTWTTGRVKTWLGSESFLQTPFLPPSLPPSLPPFLPPSLHLALPAPTCKSGISGRIVKAARGQIGGKWRRGRREGG
jgi:hypothetical protein